MKLSEVLKDWPEKMTNDNSYNYTSFERTQFNNAITSCDREIDEEALYQVILDTYRKNGSLGCLKEYKKQIIKSMPTWLKPTERK